MKILAIDTSASAGSVAVTDGARLMAALTLDIDFTHARRLMRDIDLVLRAVGLEPTQLDGIALTLGPGSFTGLRIGVATAKGMALAANLPVVGVTTLDALAMNLFGCGERPVWALVDARKGEVYAAEYRSRADGVPAREGELLLLSPGNLAAKVSPHPAIFLGDGIPLCRETLERALGQGNCLFAPSHLWGVRAEVVAMLGRELLSRGEVLDLATFGPLYIRPSEAELKAGA